MVGGDGTCAPAARCNCGKRLNTRHLKRSPLCRAFYEIGDDVMADESPCDTDEEVVETPQVSEIVARAANEELRCRVWPGILPASVSNEVSATPTSS